jgi:hypothetical protein
MGGAIVIVENKMTRVYPRVMLRSGETYFFPEAAKVIRFQESKPTTSSEMKILPDGSVRLPVNDPYQDACALLYFGGETTISITDAQSCKALREWCDWRVAEEGRIIV